MSNQPDLLSVFVQSAFQKLSIAELFDTPATLHAALAEGMPQFIWRVTAGSHGFVNIEAEMGNVKETWILQLSLTKGRSISRTLPPKPRTFDTWKPDVEIEPYVHSDGEGHQYRG